LWLRKSFDATERELGQLAKVAGAGRTAVDAGANEGWYTYPLARLFKRVVSFEPNGALLRDLRASNLNNVEIHELALSDRHGAAELFVPVCKGVPLDGWASLDRDHLERRDGEIRVPIVTRTLDSFGLPEVDFLKIDVEGHEVQVLIGARETLRRCRPVVLVEAQPGKLADVERMLEECGLRSVAEEEAGVQLTPGNFLFREAEGAGFRGSRIR
jgi:FkbM family methyltransferase